MPNISKIVVKDVGQANWIELLDENDIVRVVFDMGMPRTEKTAIVNAKISNLYATQNDKPIFVLSHWHADHYHAILALKSNISNYFSKVIYPTPTPTNVKSNELNALFNSLGNNNSPEKLGSANASYLIKDANTTIGITNVSLYKSKNIGIENNRCLSLIVTTKKNICFLTGDMKYDFIYEIMKNKYPNDSRNLILIVPHHGGAAGTIDTSQNSKFSRAIISVGANNTYRHPIKEVIKSFKNKTIIECTCNNNGQDIPINL